MPNDFLQYFASLEVSECRLPFNFGGATQSGRLNDHINNQDAVSLANDSGHIVGVVCDGCSSAPGYSNNEVGARLIAALVARHTMKISRRYGVAGLSGNLASLETRLCNALSSLAGIMAVKKSRDQFIESYLMTTILACAVDAKSYVIFGCGDGQVWRNNELVYSGEEGEGRYLSYRLRSAGNWKARLKSGDMAFRIYGQGRTEELKSLLLATDGFEDISKRYTHYLQQFLSPHPSKEPGFHPNSEIEFRYDLWYQDDVERWASTQDAHDDRSFVFLRRSD